MRKLTAWVLILLLALHLPAKSENEERQESLAGVWQFLGGGEVMGYGFRLNADGTGLWLDSDDITHCPPKHLKETGEGFTWRMIDRGTFQLRTAKGSDRRYPLDWYGDRIHFASGDGGGFYGKFDEAAVRAEIEKRVAAKTASEFDLLVLDYLEDALEDNLADRLGLRSVNAEVQWYADQPRVQVDAWHIGRELSLKMVFTPTTTSVMVEDPAHQFKPSEWSSHAAVGIDTAAMYYQVAAAAMEQAFEFAEQERMLTEEVKPLPREDNASDRAIRIELEQKVEKGTADDFDLLALDALNGIMAGRLTAMGLRDVRLHLDWQRTPHTVLADGWHAGEDLRVILRFTPCTVGAHVGDYDGEWSSIPDPALSHHFRQGATSYYEDALLMMDSEIASARQQAKQEELPGELKGFTGQFPEGRRYSVYRGPGKHYGRGAGGKAAVSTDGPITCYGTWNGWMLISYDLSADKARFGWVSTGELPASTVEACADLDLDASGLGYRYGIILDSARITDDPFGTREPIGSFPAGTSVHCLATASGWMLVEGFIGNTLRIGFVDRALVDMQYGYTADTKLIAPSGARWSQEEIRAAMEAVRDSIHYSGKGMHLLELRYPVEENASANTDWIPRDADRRIEWMRFHGDVSSISYTDYEIADHGLARDLIFYAWREPDGPWNGGLGGYE